jgi:hypothetical protein
MTTVWPSSNYPIALDTFAPALIDSVDFVLASHQNVPAGALVAVETKLGKDGDPVTGLGGVSFEPSGKSSNPGGVGIPTIWADNTGGPGFILRYTDDTGSTYTLASSATSTVQYVYDGSIAVAANPVLNLKQGAYNVSDTRVPLQQERVEFQDLSLYSSLTFGGAAHNTAIFGQYIYRLSSNTLSKIRVSDQVVEVSASVTPAEGGIAVAAGKIFVACNTTTTIYVYDVVTLALSTSFAYSGITTTSNESYVTANDTHVFVEIGTSGNYGFEVYTHAGALAGTVVRSGGNSSNGCLAVDNTYVYLCNSTLDVMERFAISGYAYVDVLSFNGASGVVALGDGTFLLASFADSVVSWYNASLVNIDSYVVSGVTCLSYTGTHVCVTDGTSTAKLYYAPGLKKSLIGVDTAISGRTISFQDGSMSKPVYASDILKNYEDLATIKGSYVTSFNTRTGAVVPADGDYTADQVHLADIDGATVDSIQDMINYHQGRGLISGGLVTVSATTGAVDVSSGVVLCKDSAAVGSDTGFVQFSATPDLVLTDNSINYIYVDYNSGTPAVLAGTSSAVLFSRDKVALDLAYRQGSDVLLVNYDNGFLDFNMALTQRFVEVAIGRGSAIAEWAYGAMLSEIGTLNLKLTAGVFYGGVGRKTSSAFDTSVADTFDYIYRDGIGGHTVVSSQTAIDNLQYDDGSGSLQTLANNKYGVHWVYLDFSGSNLYVVYGLNSYTLEEAQNALPPSDIPDNLVDFSIRVGKVIVAKSGTSLIVQSAFGAPVSSSGIPVHNGLSGLQGGSSTTDEFYHVDAAGEIAAARMSRYVTATGEPIGFQYTSDPDNQQAAVDTTARTVTLSGVDISALYNGDDIGVANGWVSSSYTAAPTTTQYLYYDGSFTWSSLPWSFNTVQICAVVYNSAGTFLFGLEEMHGCGMSTASHEEMHNLHGTYRYSGGDVSGIVLSSTTASERRPIVSECVVADEDRKSRLLVHNTQNNYSQVYLTGAGALTNLVTGSTDIVPLNAGAPRYNQYTGGAWQLTDIPTAKYGVVFLYALPVTKDAASQLARFIYIPGQDYFDSLSLAQQYYPQELNLGEFSSLVAEFVPIQRFIINRTGGDWTVEESLRLEGSRTITVGSVAGSFLSTVSTDSTLTGTGTSTDPLAVGPHAPNHEYLGGDEVNPGNMQGSITSTAQKFKISNGVTTGSTDYAGVEFRGLTAESEFNIDTPANYQSIMIGEKHVIVTSTIASENRVYNRITGEKILDATELLPYTRGFIAPDDKLYYFTGVNVRIYNPLLNITTTKYQAALVAGYGGIVEKDGILHIVDGAKTYFQYNMDTNVLSNIAGPIGISNRAYALCFVGEKLFVLDGDNTSTADVYVRNINTSTGAIDDSSNAYSVVVSSLTSSSVSPFFNTLCVALGDYSSKKILYLDPDDLTNELYNNTFSFQGNYTDIYEGKLYSLDNASDKIVVYQLPSLTLNAPNHIDGSNINSSDFIYDGGHYSYLDWCRASKQLISDRYNDYIDLKRSDQFTVPSGTASGTYDIKIPNVLQDVSGAEEVASLITDVVLQVRNTTSVLVAISQHIDAADYPNMKTANTENTLQPTSIDWLDSIEQITTGTPGTLTIRVTWDTTSRASDVIVHYHVRSRGPVLLKEPTPI